MPKWIIYYADGFKYTSEDGSPDASPKWGVVAIAQVVEGQVMPLVGDYFVYRGRWYNHDLSGLIDQLTHYSKEITAFRLGRYVNDPIYQDILKEIYTNGRTLSLRAGII